MSGLSGCMAFVDNDGRHDLLEERIRGVMQPDDEARQGCVAVAAPGHRTGSAGRPGKQQATGTGQGRTSTPHRIR